MRADEFVGALDDERIVAAIREIEARTRAEIRVHVEDDPVPDVRAAAQETFEALGMTATAERNGVLVYVAPETQGFAVLGDSGIHERCGQGFWDAVAEAMRGEFKAGRFTEGIVAGVRAAGEELARHFPRREGDADRNELPDAISRS